MVGNTTLRMVLLILTTMRLNPEREAIGLAAYWLRWR
jgi:hypothetical protein